MTQTGFFRVTETKNNGKKVLKYEVNNKLLKRSFTRTDILELKKAVEKAKLLWGIYDKELANEYKQIYNLKTLQGKYGLKGD